ncbi:RNA polymerase sigma factor [Alicyclobacillus fodiniaquatilis]|uniref:RNA polymerase sigma factor n=1 Tax=Alicyclobacillus fodiniaquatilis TaxID=1661150 RepID=A0ABW4JQ70_9BACL
MSLVRRWKSGDADAFPMIQSEFGEGLRKIVSRLVGKEYTDDVMQDTYQRAYHYRHTLRDEQKLGPWLAQIARNQCKERLKQNYADGLVARPGDDLMDILAEYNVDRPFMNLIDQVTLRIDLERAFSHLPKLNREVLDLHYVQELPVPDIAKLLGLPVSTVKWRIHRGLELCRLQMLEYQFEQGRTKEDKTK